MSPVAARRALAFGVFDHMDRGAVPLGRQYEDRLRLIEAYDRAGFHAYHLAEHHSTPLGMAPSPSVFLAAVAQRTQRLRFGPLVYTLSLYHPLRLVEEICMLDEMSGGRFELGIGRGISPYEVGYYGVDPAKTQEIYIEALAVIRQGLTQRSVDFAGKYFTFRNVPVELTPVQRPHPPLWYGLARPDGVAWAAQNRVNVITNVPVAAARTMTDRYRQEWAAAGHPAHEIPFLGMSRYVVVAESDGEAFALARSAYRRWYESFILLWDKHGGRPPFAAYPDNYEAVEERGYGIAGSPARVREVLGRQVAEAGVNYLVCRFAFGDLPAEASLRSVELFKSAVMTDIAGIAAAATGAQG
jgi:alkanesulfonate monooxygenase SsuD/methylene tetrahydromethanopterin reductase-like flavin-dependent oxidoreductase (luciferase family)